MNILGVILARGGSKGIPRKNIKLLCGHPLISYSIYAGLHAKSITHLVVSTDDEEIAEVAREYGAEVPFIRPADFARDHIFSRDALYHAVIESEKYFQTTFAYVVELVNTNPFRDAEDIDRAINKLIDTSADSVISVTRIYDHHPVRIKRIVENDQIRDFCNEFPEGEGSRRQGLEPAYVRNGGIYALKRSTIVDNYTRIGKDSRPFIMPAEKSINIDELIDFYLAESLIKKGLCHNHPVKIFPRINLLYYPNPVKPKMLFTAPYDFIPGLMEHLIHMYDVTFAYQASRHQIAALLADKEIWITSTAPPYLIGKDIIDCANNLRILATPSTGTTHIDSAYIKERGVKILTIKDSETVKNIYASSEATFALLLILVKKIYSACEKSKQGMHREIEPELRSIELFGKTLGIIGLGRIGSNTARYAHAFGMEVMAYDPYNENPPGNVEIHNDLETVLRHSDFIVLSIPFSKHYECFMDEEKFRMMKEGAYFVNTSRGELVDENALLAALTRGKLKGAAVDVISNEQQADKWEHPLMAYARDNNNLLCTPHISGLTIESETKATWEIINQIDTFFSEKGL